VQNWESQNWALLIGEPPRTLFPPKKVGNGGNKPWGPLGENKKFWWALTWPKKAFGS